MLAALDRHHDSALEASNIIARLLATTADPPVAVPEVARTLLRMGAVTRLSHILRPMHEAGHDNGVEQYGAPYAEVSTELKLPASKQIMHMLDCCIAITRFHAECLHFRMLC